MLGHGLYHTSCTGNINVPHLLTIEHTGTQRINDECKVDNRVRTVSVDEIEKLITGTLFRKINLFKMRKRDGGRRGMKVHAYDFEAARELKQPESQVS